MNPLDVLKLALIELSRDWNLERPLIVGGGFGLYLRQESLRLSGERTLLAQLPEPRATNDIDLFIAMELLVSVASVQAIQSRIEALGYTPIESAEYFQWRREDSLGHEVKLDLLCGPIGDHASQLNTGKLPRVRPKAPRGSLRLHARLTDEAIELDERALPFAISTTDAQGQPATCTIARPHPFTYLMMKLFAFDDRKSDDRKDVGRHHAMDLYRVVGMLTEIEYRECLELGRNYQNDTRVVRARQIVTDRFSQPTSLGMLRLREHPLFRDGFPIDEFSSVLAEIMQA